MMHIFYFKLRALSVVIAVSALLIGCQPPTNQSVAEQAEDANNTAPDIASSVVIDDDTIAMSSDSILNIKSSRYQPSLGLQGKIEPIKQANFKAIKPTLVKQVLVQEGQWVEQGTPLLILQHDNSEDVGSGAINNATTSAQQTGDVEQNKQSVTNNNEKTRNDNKVEENATATVATAPKQTASMITIRASFSGRVNHLAIKSEQRLKANTLLLNISDDTHLHFIASVPIQAQPQLSIGQSVNFTTQQEQRKYTGQISRFVKDNDSAQLLVYVQVLDKDIGQEAGLIPDMVVTGRVDYGQIEVGTIVPEIAIHDADLTALQSPPYQPLTPLAANIWIIKQDQRLTRQPVEVVEYDPMTKQYLIAGINNDSLICLADLPIESAGKQVVIS